MSSNSEIVKKDPEVLEARFVDVMEHLTIIDKELTNLVNHFNDGHGSLSDLKFENSDIADSISTRGFTTGPAYTLIKENNNKFSLLKNIKNPHFLREEEAIKEEMKFEEKFNNTDREDFEDESLEAFQKRFESAKLLHETDKGGEKQELESEMVEVDFDEIFNRFGIMSRPVKLYAARNSFTKMLENIVSIANELTELRMKYSKQELFFSVALMFSCMIKHTFISKLSYML